MFKKNKKVYVVTGFCWEPENSVSYPLRIDKVFSTYKKALKYVNDIWISIQKEANEMGYEMTKLFFNMDFQTLEVEYKDGTIENIVITESEVQ